MGRNFSFTTIFPCTKIQLGCLIKDQIGDKPDTQKARPGKSVHKKLSFRTELKLQIFRAKSLAINMKNNRARVK